MLYYKEQIMNTTVQIMDDELQQTELASNIS